MVKMTLNELSLLSGTAFKPVDEVTSGFLRRFYGSPNTALVAYDSKASVYHVQLTDDSFGLLSKAWADYEIARRRTPQS